MARGLGEDNAGLRQNLGAVMDKPFATPTNIIANNDVLIEARALEQLHEIANLNQSFESLGIQGRIERIVATPDLHVGSPFPVGVVIKAHGLVIPGAVGNDIGCGMRLCSFDITESDLEGKWDELSKNLRHIYFSGGRDIPLSPSQRDAILRQGLMGLCDTYSDNADHGIWKNLDLYDLEKQIDRHHLGGSIIADKTFSGHDKWVQSSGLKHGRDDSVGSISSGNHFCELQVVDQVIDGFAAKQYGFKQGQIACMIHTGSLLLGWGVGTHYRDKAKQDIRNNFPHIANDIPGHLNPLIEDDLRDSYINDMSTAANFATVNRLALGLMMKQAFEKTLGREVEMKLVWDAPHNLTWEEGGAYIHRKGATPALGASSYFNYAGEPVLLPGSMGDNSWVLSGLGNDDALSSASHGAGRALSRGKASHLKTNEMDKIRVVAPVDIQDLIARGRGDIAREMQKRLLEETPSAYKPVLPALESLEEAKVAKRVAKMRPLLTLKGLLIDQKQRSIQLSREP